MIIKKEYTKPIFYLESFHLIEHIASGCITPDSLQGALHSNGCGYNIGGLVLFSNPYAGSCQDENFATLVSGAGITNPEDMTSYELLSAMGMDCYNSMYNPGTNFFAS